MNTQSLDLNKMGLAPMQSSELQEVEGGGWLAAIVVGAVGVVATVATGGALAEVAVGATMAAYNS